QQRRLSLRRPIPRRPTKIFLSMLNASTQNPIHLNLISTTAGKMLTVFASISLTGSRGTGLDDQESPNGGVTLLDYSSMWMVVLKSRCIERSTGVNKTSFGGATSCRCR